MPPERRPGVTEPYQTPGDLGAVPQIRTELLGEDAIADDFRIDWEWTPAWTPADSAEGRDQLRTIGFTI